MRAQRFVLPCSTDGTPILASSVLGNLRLTSSASVPRVLPATTSSSSSSASSRLGDTTPATWALLAHNVVTFLDQQPHDSMRRACLRAFSTGMRVPEAAELFRVPERTLYDIRASSDHTESGQPPASSPSLSEVASLQRARTRRRMSFAEHQAHERWFRTILPVHSGDPSNRPRQYECDHVLMQWYARELDTIIGDTIALRTQEHKNNTVFGPPPDTRLLQNINAWYYNHDALRPPRTLRAYVPRHPAVIQRLLKHFLHVRKMHESWGEFDCKQCVTLRAAEDRSKKNKAQPGDDRVLIVGWQHRHIRQVQQRCYHDAQRFASVSGEHGAVVTQDFTTIELGANVSASAAERAAAKIRCLVMAIETGDKRHHYRVFMCTNTESPSSDFFFVRAAWHYLLGLPGSSTPTVPVDAALRTARSIDVWSDGASGQFKQRFALRMYLALTKLRGKPFRVNFLAPGHGHSLADACAARLKQAANRLLLSLQGSRATGELFSVASPSIKKFAHYVERHMRDTSVTLLGKIDRDESLRPNQRPLDGMKQYFSFSFGKGTEKEYVVGSVVSNQELHDTEWEVCPGPVSGKKRPRSLAAVADPSESVEKKR
jgi:hypothetical protein